ncbi:ABC transporter ATP-binding protein [Lysinibacillus pakistanensis]|uniref:ABC transporter ATP-binding protein n=1 Tax=Lysinibacillus pakistanensis TaxID=759811 RepID=A0AAX3X139_9BACI|nr:ABC transporter ATP-binding protein [Lysinibacillus pakistanensis]MDM5233254.1 ABC transporter ATP-binding protein [Lysinibacillus pakistanensis]WHY48732.1 ABC transporter ATP-binding protein [Lysinibacillus pakistanensis]WHY53745.1 ABC transporter ATP-binding protein [Lysinibacillus pakistanensis]
MVQNNSNNIAAVSNSNGTENILEVSHLKKTFHIKSPDGKKGLLRAVDDVSFTIKKGETFSLVGESGCGKSTLGRTLLGLYTPDQGSEILFNGEDITKFSKSKRKNFAKKAQLIFQDPSACLNPRRTIKQILLEPFKIHKIPNGEAKIKELMEMVGLANRFFDRFPHEMSGGQKQRVGIARALALDPELIVCDEPVSALDVSIQAQVINLLEDLQKQLNLTYLFISHDLSVVHHISDRVAVMYLGKIVELSTRDQLYEKTQHPYTKSLLSSVPDITDEHREKIILTGDVPSPSNPPAGCRFHTRCPVAMDICKTQEPIFIQTDSKHFAACHLQTK